MNNAKPWVYVLSEPRLWTVGFYDPAGKWHTDSDHSSPEEAAERVGLLNGPPLDSGYRERVARAVVSAASGLNERSIPEAVVSVDAKSDELYQIVLIAMEQIKP